MLGNPRKTEDAEHVDAPDAATTRHGGTASVGVPFRGRTTKYRCRHIKGRSFVRERA